MVDLAPAIDYDRLDEILERFFLYSAARDGRGGDGAYKLSFKNTAGYLYREEGYKSRVSREAWDRLHTETWSRSMVGGGTIAAHVLDGLGARVNLVDWNRVRELAHAAGDSEKCAGLEGALYDLYCGDDDPAAFRSLMAILGAKYDLLAYFMFIRDGSCYLPVSPGRLDKALGLLNIDHKLSFNCSWENYNAFNAIAADIREEMEVVLPKPDNTSFELIDAHTFLWIIGQESFTGFCQGGTSE